MCVQIETKTFHTGCRLASQASHSIDTRKLVDSFGIYIRNDSGAGLLAHGQISSYPPLPRFRLRGILLASLKCQRPLECWATRAGMSSGSEGGWPRSFTGADF